jgi:DNA polymerase-3 subunit delta'
MNDNWGLLGHEWAVDMLRHHLRHDGLRHAYLFAGPAGIGRRTLARRVAQALNCEKPIERGEPCRVCRACAQIDEERYPDLSVVQAETEGGVLKVEQVREARRSLTLKPYQGNFRVALFLRFQEANDSAANALLKTLEEAPAHAVLILTADQPERLLPTIVSRCEILRLRPLPVEAVAAYLMERGADEERARLIAHISGGRAGYARKLMDDATLLEKREERLNDLQTLLPSARVAKFAYADKLAKDKDAMRATILIWLSYWRDVMLRAAQAETSLVNVDRNMEIEFLAGRLSLAAARRAVVALEKALAQMERNVNSRLLLEVLLLDLPKA